MSIAAKYRQYDNLRRRPTKAQTTPRKTTESTPTKAEQKVLRETSPNAVAATPSKDSKSAKSPQSAELPVVQEEEPTPACIRHALGPTPQKDGAVLGIFDMLSAGTPSKAKTGAQLTSGSLVTGTPSKPNAPVSSDRHLSRTPHSPGKRFYLDAFAGTPLKRKREDDDHTPVGTSKLFATPSFLRRNWPHSQPGDNAVGATAANPPFNKRLLVRSLSTIIQGLKRQEEDRMEDEWDILNEMEAEERGEVVRPAALPKVLVEDSQGAEMPLGPDQGIDSSEEDGDADPGALDANGNPRKVWKKKGLKRQTRRVIMRPVLQKAKSAPGALLPGVEGLEAIVEETQVQEPLRRRTCGNDDEDEFVDEQSDAGTKHDGQHSWNEKGTKVPAKGRKKAGSEAKNMEKTKKVKPEAHANFRKLKIKNKNSKAKGRGGRFGRR